MQTLEYKPPVCYNGRQGAFIMGIYLNPGDKRFIEALNSEIYVDKTEIISYLNRLVNTEQKYVCVSRPRRFGKSVTANMLASYYEKGDSRWLFEDKMLAGDENWDRHLNQFDVIRVGMTDFIKENKDVRLSLNKMASRIIDELSETYPDVKYDPDDFVYSMEKFFMGSNTPFIIILDEWDVVFRERKGDDAGQRLYLDFLRDWLKDKGYVALAYMTGILPIKKYGKHSALNMFREYSVMDPMQFAPYTGFTEEEVISLCREYGRDYEKLKEWYDGYELRDIVPPDPRFELKKRTGMEKEQTVYAVYNPLSVVNAVSTGIIKNYWNKTETYDALSDYIKMDYDGLKEAVALLMDGGRLRVNTGTYQNDMTSFRSRDDVLTMLIHLGYLAYDSMSEEVFIPNRELLDEFRNSTSSQEWAGIFEAFGKSEELLEATWRLNESKVAELLEWFHDTTENKTYNSEAALSYAVQMAYYAAQKHYTVIQELDSGKGYVDLVYLPSPKSPDKPALLIELKYNKTRETASEQILKRNYPQRLTHYKDKLLLISINYDKDVSAKGPQYKHHSCHIEMA